MPATWWIYLIGVFWAPALRCWQCRFGKPHRTPRWLRYRYLSKYEQIEENLKMLDDPASDGTETLSSE